MFEEKKPSDKDMRQIWHLLKIDHNLKKKDIKELNHLHGYFFELELNRGDKYWISYKKPHNRLFISIVSH